MSLKPLSCKLYVGSTYINVKVYYNTVYVCFDIVNTIWSKMTKKHEIYFFYDFPNFFPYHHIFLSHFAKYDILSKIQPT